MCYLWLLVVMAATVQAQITKMYLTNPKMYVSDGISPDTCHFGEFTKTQLIIRGYCSFIKAQYEAGFDESIVISSIVLKDKTCEEPMIDKYLEKLPLAKRVVIKKVYIESSSVDSYLVYADKNILLFVFKPQPTYTPRKFKIKIPNYSEMAAEFNGVSVEISDPKKQLSANKKSLKFVVSKPQGYTDYPCQAYNAIKLAKYISNQYPYLNLSQEDESKFIEFLAKADQN